MKPKGKLKIPVTRIPSDDCAVTIGQVIVDGEVQTEGTPYYVHTDEWVEMMPVMTVKEVLNLSAMQQVSGDNAGLSTSLETLCKELSQRVLAWNWTDMLGEALEQPYNRPDVLQMLTSDELLWLVTAAGGSETSDDRKKD